MKFSLSGTTKKQNNKWSCKIILETPDGEKTFLQSDYAYKTDDEALMAMKNKMDEVLALFGKENIEVVSEETRSFPDSLGNLLE